VLCVQTSEDRAPTGVVDSPWTRLVLVRRAVMSGGVARAERRPRCAGSRAASCPALDRALSDAVGGPPLSRRRSQPPRPDARPCVPPHAAGLDLGSAASWACVPAARDAQPVRSFGPFTPALLALAEWLISCRLGTVAMEATGVSGIPV
jgi:hypothetical protein